MRKVRHKKKIEAQKAIDSKRLSKPARLASKAAPSEAETQAARAVIEDLDIEAWLRQNMSPNTAGYLVAVEGVCPLECVLKRAETLRTCSHADVLADPGMVDFVNVLLGRRPAKRLSPFVWPQNLNSFPIKLGPLVVAHLEQCECRVLS